MDIRIFENYEGITAGFTGKPDLADLRRDAMADEAEQTGGTVVKACLVHGWDICAVTKEGLLGPYVEAAETDGLVTDLKNVTLTTTHADCIPVWAYDPVKKVIGLAHAGWRGTNDCVVCNLIDCMVEEYQCDSDDIRAYIGPGIDPCCFEVEEDVINEFLDSMPWTEDYMYEDGNKKGKYRIDLKGINQELLEIEGVPQENIEVSSECTCCPGNRDRFYSWRRDRDRHRMLAYIKLE